MGEPIGVKRVLIVEPHLSKARALARLLDEGAEVAVCRDYSSAQAQLSSQTPDLLVTQLRLREYNGLHLTYLIAALGAGTRSIVYVDAHDPRVACEVQAAGAFYEVRDRLATALHAYVKAELPAHDRRDVTHRDRRSPSRGGRRASDGARRSTRSRPSVH